MYFLINCNNNLLLMHMSLNCHLPKRSENQSVSRISVYS